MKSSERFQRTLNYQNPDRVPYFEEGIRTEVLQAWVRQGFPQAMKIYAQFPYDQRIEIQPDLDPKPEIVSYPQNTDELEHYAGHFLPGTQSRMPENWPSLKRTIETSDSVRMLRVTEGFFLAMGVMGWRRFEDVLFALKDNPSLVRGMMDIHGELAAQLAENILSQVEIDAAIFSEPIGDNNGSLISPEDYREFALNSYRPIFKVLDRHRVRQRIFRTYANARNLLPTLLDWGINCLWACEVYTEAMDYVKLRQEYGLDLRLIGGIDTDLLYLDRKRIADELLTKIPVLMSQGGYIPLADGRIREDIPFENYRFYRTLLNRLIEQG